MTATPLQHQGAQTLGAGSSTPEGEVPGIDADQEIIAKVLAGSKDSFGVLITRYSDPLYRHALGMTGSPDVAEDLLQASFIKAYQHLGEVRGRFDAWVFRIVANSCKDWLKNIRRTHVSYDEDDQPSTYSTPYSGGPLQINYSQTLKARIIKNGVPSVGVASSTYILDSTQFPGPPSPSDVTAPSITVDLPEPSQ